MMDKHEFERRVHIVTEQCEGIIPHCEAFYVHSIYYAADRAIDAYSRYQRSVAGGASADLIVAMMQEALTHAAALSRFFWPAKDAPLHKARGARLRKAFEISDDSSLKNRELRNAFEHFDEHLDKFLLERDTGFFFPTPMLDDHRLADDSTGSIFKLLDSDAGCLVILSKKFFFVPIMEEVGRILSTTKPHLGDGRLFGA